MLSIIKNDLILFRDKMLFLVPIMSVSLILLFPKGDEGYFIIGLPLVFIISLLIFVQDDKSKGTQMYLRLPVSRKEIAWGRFFSTWTLTGFSAIYIMLLGLFLSLFYPDARTGFVAQLNFQTLYIYLWFLSLLNLLALPILFALLGKGLQAMMMIGLGLNVILGIFFLRYQGSGADPFALIRSAVLFMNASHTGVLAFLISSILLAGVNAINLFCCQWILERKEF